MGNILMTSSLENTHYEVLIANVMSFLTLYKEYI